MSDVAATITGQNVAANFGTLDGVSGGVALTVPNRVVSVASGAALKMSALADAVSGAVLTISGTLTEARSLIARDMGGTIALTSDDPRLVLAKRPLGGSSFQSFPAYDAGIAAASLDLSAVVARANFGA